MRYEETACHLFQFESSVILPSGNNCNITAILPTVLDTVCISSIFVKVEYLFSNNKRIFVYIKCYELETKQISAKFQRHCLQTCFQQIIIFRTYGSPYRKTFSYIKQWQKALPKDLFAVRLGIVMKVFGV